MLNRDLRVAALILFYKLPSALPINPVWKSEGDTEKQMATEIFKNYENSVQKSSRAGNKPKHSR